MEIRSGVYRHYKNKDYAVIGCARHTETDEEFVVYRALYGERELWIRPKEMFLDRVTVDGQSVPRFMYIGNHDSEGEWAKGKSSEEF